MKRGDESLNKLVNDKADKNREFCQKYALIKLRICNSYQIVNMIA